MGLSSESAIEVSSLTKRYGKLVAVDHVDFNVGKGEVFGFLGPNGAGKTTTINMLTGVTKPTAGTALISGFDIARATIEAKKLVGVVPEVFCLYDEMTAWDNLNFSAKLHNVSKRKRMALGQQRLQLFGLYERRNDRVSTFSGGMKKRLMIATALMHDPEILFLDEPTTGLDVQSARQIRALVKELNERGVTVFLTTHYIEEADQLCQRIAILDRGRIITVGTPEALKSIVQTENIVEVSFDHAGDIASELAELSHVRNVIVAGDKFRLYVEDPKDTLPSLIHFAEKKRLQVVSVNMVRPTLEDAFVKLTGLRPELMALEKQHTQPR
jgi:ABC-2 type transport system ATP-binding protein